MVTATKFFIRPKGLWRWADRFLREEDGPTAVEYAVMLAMILGVCFVAIGLFGGQTGESFVNSLEEIETKFSESHEAGE